MILPFVLEKVILSFVLEMVGLAFDFVTCYSVGIWEVLDTVLVCSWTRAPALYAGWGKLTSSAEYYLQLPVDSAPCFSNVDELVVQSLDWGSLTLEPVSLQIDLFGFGCNLGFET